MGTFDYGLVPWKRRGAGGGKAPPWRVWGGKEELQKGISTRQHRAV